MNQHTSYVYHLEHLEEEMGTKMEIHVIADVSEHWVTQTLLRRAIKICKMDGRSSSAVLWICQEAEKSGTSLKTCQAFSVNILTREVSIQRSMINSCHIHILAQFQPSDSELLLQRPQYFMFWIKSFLYLPIQTSLNVFAIFSLGWNQSIFGFVHQNQTKTHKHMWE